jgi:predicted DNA binding CopG/RHH family protein
MSPKKVNIGRKPDSVSKPSNVEEWVANREADSSVQEPSTEQTPEKMKRLTLDIPEWLHRAIKRKAVEEGVTMADQLRALLEKHYK